MRRLLDLLAGQGSHDLGIHLGPVGVSSPWAAQRSLTLTTIPLWFVVTPLAKTGWLFSYRSAAPSVTSRVWPSKAMGAERTPCPSFLKEGRMVSRIISRYGGEWITQSPGWRT